MFSVTKLIETISSFFKKIKEGKMRERDRERLYLFLLQKKVKEKRETMIEFVAKF